MMLDQPTLDLGPTTERDRYWREARFLAGAFIASYSSPRTREGYAADLRSYFDFLSRFTPDIDPIHHVRRLAGGD